MPPDGGEHDGPGEAEERGEHEPPALVPRREAVQPEERHEEIHHDHERELQGETTHEPAVEAGGDPRVNQRSEPGPQAVAHHVHRAREAAGQEELGGLEGHAHETRGDDGTDMPDGVRRADAKEKAQGKKEQHICHHVRGVGQPGQREHGGAGEAEGGEGDDGGDEDHVAEEQSSRGQALRHEPELR